MTLARRLRKVRRQRGTRFHGWGTSGQHRGSGMRGGTGKSGWTKHKWTRTVKYESERIGKSGFRCPTGESELTTVNVGDLEGLLDVNKIRDVKNDIPKLDLSKLGYQKLLGKGTIKKPIHLIVRKWSKTAEKKVEGSGGQMVRPQ